MRLVVCLLVLGCSRPAPEVEVDPVTPEQATAFAAEIAKAAQPCDEAKVRALIDDRAMLARFQKGGASISTAAAAEQLERDHVGAKVLCAWQSKAEDYKLLRIRTVDGQPRPLFRRIMKDARTGLRAVGYDELMLGTTRSDHKVRIIDVYSFIQGQWLTESLRGLTDATIDSADGASDAQAIAEKLQKARTLQQAGEPKEALALVDSVPAKVRKSRATQMMRVALASSISQEAYKAALDEVAATFPNDPSVAMLACRRYAVALRQIERRVGIARFGWGRGRPGDGIVGRTPLGHECFARHAAYSGVATSPA